MRSARPLAHALVPFALACLIAAALALEHGRPFTVSAVAFDSAASVLHYDRIVEGHRLERFLSTTPKPLLTTIFGPLYALTGDWRALSWATVAAFSIAAGLLMHLVRRVEGGRAALFAVVALAGSPALLFETSLALATPWAMLLWAVAALAVTGPRPRYAVAGIALGLAALARIETLVVVAAATVVLLVASFLPGRPHGRVPSSAWLLLLAFLAIPAAMAHDWLLTGDPLFWTTVSQRYSAAAGSIPSPAEVALMLAGRYGDQGGLVILALIGSARLVARRHWGLVTGLVALGPGMAAFLIALAIRGIFVSERYFAAIDAAIIVAAAIGLMAIAVELPEMPRMAGRFPVRARRALGSVLPAAAVVLIAVVLTSGWAGLWQPSRAAIRSQHDQALSAQAAAPTLRAAIDAVPGARTWPESGATPPRVPLLLVPTPLVPMLSLELDLPLTQIGSFDADGIDLAAGIPSAGQIVLLAPVPHGPEGAGAAPLLVDLPTVVDDVLIVPLASDPGLGYRIVRIDQAP